MRLEGWDAARHTAVASLLVGAGYNTVVAASVVETSTTEDPGAVVRKWTFTLSPTRSDFKIKVVGTTNNVLVTYHVAERWDLAFT